MLRRKRLIYRRGQRINRFRRSIEGILDFGGVGYVPQMPVSHIPDGAEWAGLVNLQEWTEEAAIDNPLSNFESPGYSLPCGRRLAVAAG